MSKDALDRGGACRHGRAAVSLLAGMLFLALACQGPVTSKGSPWPRTPREAVPSIDDGDVPPGGSSPSGTEQPRSIPLEASDVTPTLTLEEAINRALEANYRLADVRDSVALARYSLAAAEADFELKVFPRASSAVSGGDEDRDVDDQYGLGVELRKLFPIGTDVSLEPRLDRVGGQFRTSLRASLSQPLLRGRDPEFVLSAVQGSEFAFRTARRSHYLAQVSTVLSTVEAVYQVVRQRELARLNAESVERLKGHVEAARAKERAGLASSIDVYRATLELNGADENLTVARESLGDALDSLWVLLALPVTLPLDVEAPLEYELVRTTPDEAVETALAERVEILQVEDTVREAERLSRVALHNTLPDVDLVLSYTRFGESDSLGRSARLDEDTYFVGVSSQTDIARTAEWAAYAQSQLRVDSAVRALELQRDLVARDTQQELRSLRRAEKRIEIQQDQIRQAQGKLEIARVKFRRGLSTNFDVIEAEDELRRAQTGLVSAVTDYIVGTWRFRASLGVLLERPPDL